MQTTLGLTDPTDPLYGYPTLNDLDFDFLSTIPQDHQAEIHETPLESNPTPASDSKSTRRQLLPRMTSEPAPALAATMYSTLPGSCPDSAMNGEQINNIIQRLMTLENTMPTFRQISDLLARVTGMETRLTGMETRKTNLDTRQTSTDNRQATIETRLSAIETKQMEL